MNPTVNISTLYSLGVSRSRPGYLRSSNRGPGDGKREEGERGRGVRVQEDRNDRG